MTSEYIFFLQSNFVDVNRLPILVILKNDENV